MTKEDKQIIDRAVKENWRIGDRTRLKRLLKKNLELYRENVELEQKLEQTEKDLADYQFNYPKIKELEKENEELKGSLELYESGGCRATNLFECGVVKELKDQLTKAKEIIKDLMSFPVQLCDCRHTVDFEKTREKAVQFLKEIEK